MREMMRETSRDDDPSHDGTKSKTWSLLVLFILSLTQRTSRPGWPTWTWPSSDSESSVFDTMSPLPYHDSHKNQQRFRVKQLECVVDLFYPTDSDIISGWHNKPFLKIANALSWRVRQRAWEECGDIGFPELESFRPFSGPFINFS